MHKLLLFDIDGTLIRSAGVGREAMNLAYSKIFGFENGFENIHMMGRTDPGILRDVLEKHDVPWNEDQVRMFQEHYYTLLEEELPKPRTGKYVCPGILPLLEILKKEEEIILGLLTGNWKISAYMKLKHFKLDHFFKFGAFADDSPIRNELVPFAIKHCREMTGMEIIRKNVYVIGDTPLDIECGRVHSTQTIGVATGFHSQQSMVDAGADFVFDDFADYQSVLKIIL